MMESIARTSEAVKPDQPHSVAFTKTVKDGWRPDSVKVYYSNGGADTALAECVRLMKAADEAAREANGWNATEEKNENGN